MDKEDKIKQIKNRGSNTTYPVFYQGKQRQMPVYEIDVSLLKFNVFNGRIASEAMEYSSTEGSDLALIDSEEANAIISDWIWQKSEAANLKSKIDILTKGQMRPGVITRDGILVDGNRRFMIIRKLNQEGHDIKFKTIILNEAYSDGGVEAKDIKTLEAQLQLGEDKKVDYSPIEKYLVVMNFVEDYVEVKSPSMTYEQIAETLNLKNRKEVEKNYRVAKLMMNYLDHINANRMPSRLNNTEDLFLNLEKNISLFNNSKGKISWSPDSDDIDEYIETAFNLIRWNYNSDDKGDWDSKSLRDIFFNNSNKSIFSSEDIWGKFYGKISQVENIDVSDTSLEEYQKMGLDSKVAKQKIDIDWADKANDNVKSALGEAKSKINDQRNINQPKIYLKDSLNKLLNLIKEEEFELNGNIKFKDQYILQNLQNLHDSNENYRIVDSIRKIAEFIKRRIK